MTTTTTSRQRTPGSGGNRKGKRASFGSIRKLPSKRFQARYTGPDGRTHTAPVTFENKGAADAWLAMERTRITNDAWKPASAESQVSLATYAETWLAGRDLLKPSTRHHYQRLLDVQILPALGDRRLKTITPDVVRAWHTGLGNATPTLRSHAYSLLRTILATAVQDGLLPANPCHIRGASSSRRVKKIEPASLEELNALVAAMPERYRAMTLVAAWCGLRFGEVTELRRSDVDLTKGIVKVSRAVTRVHGAFIVGKPKSDKGIRDVPIPPHLLPVLRDHLAASIAGGRDGLLFPAKSDPTQHMSQQSLIRVFYPARVAIGRPDLRWHDLRHTVGTMLAQEGATTAELMAWMGHSSPATSLLYQHAAKGRLDDLAVRLSRRAGYGA